MANFLENNKQIIKDKRVIELGAGTGLVGMITSVLGNAPVLNRCITFYYTYYTSSICVL